MPGEGLLLCASQPSPRPPPGPPLPSGFSIVQNASLPVRPGLGGLRGQSWMPRPPGASGGSPRTTAGMPPVWTTLSTKQMGLLQSSRQDPDLQDPGSRRPTSRAPCVNPLHRYCTCPGCAGGRRGCLLNKPQPTSGASPRESSLWLTPRPGCCHPSPAYPCPPQKSCVGWATSLTMLSFPALFLEAELGARSGGQDNSSAPWLFWGGGGGLWGLQESRPQQHSSQRHRTTQQPVPTFSRPRATPQAWTKSSEGHTLSLQTPGLGLGGAGGVWAKAMGVSGSKRDGGFEMATVGGGGPAGCPSHPGPLR